MVDSLYTIEYLLEKNRKTFVSGETLAAELKVSRAAVWKQMRRLGESGVDIESKPRLGYRLNPARDFLFTGGIDYWLEQDGIMNKPSLTVKKHCASTNLLAKERLADITESGSPIFIIAEEQTAGRGRRGRKFYSPAGSGIYLSMAFRPQLHMNESQYVTCAAAVHIMRALVESCGRIPVIKWVNDLYYQERKICGILTEAVTDFENGKVTGIVVGVGVNVFFDTAAAPDELSTIAGGLFKPSERETAPSLNRIAAAMIRHLTALAEDHGETHFREDILPIYRDNMFLIGRNVVIEKPDGKTEAAVRGIDDEGHLLCLIDGKEVALSSGEVSLRFRPKN